MPEPETTGEIAPPLTTTIPRETASPPTPESSGEMLPPTYPPDAAPADMVPTPRLRERLAWYVGTALVSCFLVSAGLRLDRADLRAPFYYDADSLLILPMVKATVERGLGGHWRNERLGAPGIQEQYDFPVIDYVHFAIISLLSFVVSNVVLLYNLYFLLTFPLTALTAMIVFRHLRLTLPAAAVGGLLYTFLPYHYQRWENHYFLAAYWLVPLSLLPVFAVLKGCLPFFEPQQDGTYRLRLLSWRSAGYVTLAIAIASAGAYYAFFACAILAFAGLYGWAALRTYRALVAASSVAAIIVVFGFLNHLPTYIYHIRYDTNPVTARGPEEVDVFGLKITHLVLPIEDHRLTIFRAVKTMYNSPNRPSEFENRSASLGLIAATGFVGLLASLVFPFRISEWPYAPIAALTLFMVLIANIGGFGAIFNLLVTANIRCYNRISVFIAFLCFFAILWALDRYLLTRARRSNRRLRYAAWAGVLLLGMLDQTPYSWFRSGIIKTLDEQASRFHADARFFAQIEERMPGGKVFCLPYVPYPEVPELHKMPTYDHARGYIHTNTVVWSFGAIKGREADAWQGDVATPLNEKKVREMLPRLVAKGFDGVMIDGRGFPPVKDAGGRITAPLVIAEMNQAYAELQTKGSVKRLPEIIHDGKEQFFLDLRPYRDLYAQKSPAAFETIETQEREWVTVLWLGGFANSDQFINPREFQREGYWYREGPPDGRAWFLNPTDRERKFKITMTFGVFSPGTFQIKLSGLGIENDEFEIDKKPMDWEEQKYGVTREYTIAVPPGRHALRIRCIPPPGYIHADYRRLCYYIKEFKMSEIP
jgi:hypothetical protein